MRALPVRWFHSRGLIAAIVIGVAPRLAMPLHAQAAAHDEARAGRALVLQGGQWYADVAGTVGALRAELPLDRGGRWLLVPGLTYAHYTLGPPVPQIDLFAPEALVQFQLARGRLRPYVGAGAGLVLINMFHTFDPVLSVGTGLRADLTPAWGVRLELDGRAFGRFHAGSIGWSIGVARQF